jgi:NAD(P)H-hydrate epimerase
VVGDCASSRPTLDLPSGIDATTGAAPGIHVRADATLTLALPKVGLAAPTAAAATGDLYLADLGIPAAAFRRLAIFPAIPFDHRFVVPLRRLDS